MIESVVGRVQAGVEYQVWQTADGFDVVTVGAPGDVRSVERDPAAELARLSVGRACANVHVVDRLERQRSRKVQRLVPLAGPGCADDAAPSSGTRLIEPGGISRAGRRLTARLGGVTQARD